MPSRRMLRRCAPAALAAVLLATTLGGCGGSSQDDQKTAAANLAQQIKSVGSTGTDHVSDKQAHCLADGTVHDVGLDRLQHYGIITKDLEVNKSVANVKMSPTDADRLAKVFVSCIDSERLVEQQFISGANITAKQKKCVQDVIDAPSTLQILSRSFQGQQATEVYADVRDDLRKCAKLKK